MKTTYLKNLLLGAAGITMAGCGAFDRLYDKQVEVIPGQVVKTNIVWKTNVVVQAAITNETNGVISPPQIKTIILPETVVEYAPAVTVTNLVPRTDIVGGIQAAGSTPLPFAGLAGILLGWAYTAYAAVRNRQASKAMVLGIEAARRALQDTPEGQRLDAMVKEKLIAQQQLSGTISLVSGMVKNLTGSTRG